MRLRDRTRIARLARETPPVTPDTAFRLERVFGAPAQFWLNLQAKHGLSLALMAQNAELLAIKPNRVA